MSDRLCGASAHKEWHLTVLTFRRCLLCWNLEGHDSIRRVGVLVTNSTESSVGVALSLVRGVTGSLAWIGFHSPGLGHFMCSFNDLGVNSLVHSSTTVDTVFITSVLITPWSDFLIGQPTFHFPDIYAE